MNESDELTPAEKWELLGMFILTKILGFIYAVMMLIKGLFGCVVALIGLGICLIFIMAMVQSYREGDWESRLPEPTRLQQSANFPAR